MVEAWPQEFREDFYREHDLPLEPERTPPSPPRVLASFASPTSYNSTGEHAKNFLRYVRNREKPLEDAVMGHKAAAVAHLINLSLDQEKTIRWDRTAERIAA